MFPCFSELNVIRKASSKAFIFSICNKEGIPPFKSKVKTNASGIVGNASYGPSFGCHKGTGQTPRFDIYISDNANANNESYVQVGECYDVPSGVNQKFLNLDGGKKHFKPDELEVFYLQLTN